MGDILSDQAFVPHQVTYLGNRVETLPEIFPDLQVSGKRVCTLSKWHRITTDFRLLATVVPTDGASNLVFTPQSNIFLVFELDYLLQIWAEIDSASSSMR